MRRILGFALAGLLAGTAACSRSAGGERLPDLRLPTASAQEGPSLRSCPTAKCLIVYVAPWCGYCRAATPMILALRDYLQSRGVTTRIVVGKDRLAVLRDYARDFGPDTLLDPDEAFPVGGVPHFFVTDRAGAVLKEVSGVPSVKIPVEDFAAYFGLP
jgi:hypothetical protein